MNKNTTIGIVAVLIVAAAVIWYYSLPDLDKSGSSQPNLSVTAFNQTQTADATTSIAHPQDIVEYTLVAQNPTSQTISGYEMKVSIADIAKLSTLIDAGGAAYNSATDSLSWTPLDIPANESIQKRFLVRVNDLPQGTTDTVMELEHPDILAVAVASSQVAGTSTGSTAPTQSEFNAPAAGINEFFTLFAAILITIGLFFAREIRKKPTI